MLILTVKPQERLQFTVGETTFDILVTHCSRGHTCLGIDADRKTVQVLRKKLVDEGEGERRTA